MSNRLYEERAVSAIAEAIRRKGGRDTYTISEMAPAIEGLPDVLEQTELYVTENGTYTPESGQTFSVVTASFPETIIRPLHVSSNGTYTPEEGFAYNPVTVMVPSVQLHSVMIGSNGTYSAPAGEAFGRVTVDIPDVELFDLPVSSNGT